MEERHDLVDIYSQTFSTKAEEVTSSSQILEENRVLCHHCGRTSLNSAKCIGRCVADNEY